MSANVNAPETVNPRKSRFKVPPAGAVPEQTAEVASAAPVAEAPVETPSSHVETPAEVPAARVDAPVPAPISEPARQPEPVHSEPAAGEPNAVQALMSGKVAVVPVEWLERMLTPAQIQQVVTRRAGRHARTAVVRAAVAPKKRTHETSVARPEPRNPKLKFCPGCSLEKNRASEFYKMSTSKDGYQPRCKTCQLEASRVRKAGNSKGAAAVRRAGLYMLNGKPRDTIQGRDTIKRVYAYFKRHKNGVTAKQIQADLKMPASTVHWTLAKLQKTRVVRTAAA